MADRFLDMFASEDEEDEEGPKEEQDKRVSGRDKVQNYQQDEENGAMPTQPSQSRQRSVTTAMDDNYDDEEGYYQVQLGEILNNRYFISQNMGKGVFSSVVKARDIQNHNAEVAIKIIRNNEIMYRAGQKEVAIVKKLNEQDLEDKKHIIRTIGTFEHRSHLCIVFEALSMNLREVIKKYGKDIGINLKAIRIYAKQILVALNFLHRYHIVHADIKPDNILVTKNKSMLKLSDFGSADYIGDCVTTSYLVSRYYRAPEIILGLSYSFGIDIWAFGCTLFELFTGRVLFCGKNNFFMLKVIFEVKGKIPNKLSRKSEVYKKYFEDGVIGGAKLGKDLKSLMGVKSSPSNKKLLQLVDLVDKCLTLNPEHRISARDALRHPFIIEDV